MPKASDVSPRMFEHDLVDRFSRTHWSLVPILYIPVVMATLYWAYHVGTSWLITLLAFVVGGTLWTLTEYWLHRTVFHWVPKYSWGERFHFIAHGVHHVWHKDPYRLVMPPTVSITLAFVFYALFWTMAAIMHAAVGIDPNWHFGTYAGFVFGYMVYDVTHYALHHIKPRGARWKRLRAHHMNHHHNQPELRFGVSTAIWDRVFGTNGSSQTK